VGGEPPSAPHSESELEQFFDLALDLLCIAGFDGYFKRVNPAYVRTLGYPARELMSRPFFEFVHPDDCASSRTASSRRCSPAAGYAPEWTRWRPGCRCR